MKRLPMCEGSILAMPRKHLMQRVIKPQPRMTDSGLWLWDKGDRELPMTDCGLKVRMLLYAPFSVGDTVALTETWRIADMRPSEVIGSGLRWQLQIEYKADGARSAWILANSRHDKAIESWQANTKRWHSPYFMFPEFSRFHRVVNLVTAHRVQDMTIDDLIAEGWDVQKSQPWLGGTTGEDARAWYMALWDRLNPNYPWASNPWVYGLGWA